MAKGKRSYALEDAEPLKPVDTRDRLTMNFNIVHQSLSDQPVVVQDSCWKWLEHKEEPWSRKIEATTSPEDLVNKLCWVEHPGFVVVQNLTGLGRTINPTPKESAADMKRILEIGESSGTMRMLVYPGWVMPICVEDFKSLYIRSLYDAAWYRITIFSR